MPWRSTNTLPSKDGIDLLTADHKQLKNLFDAYRKLIGSPRSRHVNAEKAELVQRIALELVIHGRLEHEIFNPAARKVIANKLLMDKADVAHLTLFGLIESLLSLDPDDDTYDARVLVLWEYLQLHIQEEEKKIFTLVRKRLDVMRLGEQLKQHKAILIRELS